jgi:hypothetical protein
MSKILQRLNALVISLLALVLTSVLVAQIRSGVHPTARASPPGDDWLWPQTLEVYPAHAGDPVKLVKITKGGNEIVPGTYKMPQIAADMFQGPDAVKDWLSDASFTLRSQTSKNIAAVGIAVLFPTRRTDEECGEPPRGVDCGKDSHWCDGGCPTLIDNTLHWGLVPPMTASGLEARYAQARAGGEHWRILRQGKGPLRLPPGEEITLSLADRVEGIWVGRDPRPFFSDVLDAILRTEGLDEATGEVPCRERAKSKTGCAFAKVSKFTIGIDIVYFEDGTIWGNYGYGYALPNPDGIFTRVSEGEIPGGLKPNPPVN